MVRWILLFFSCIFIFTNCKKEEEAVIAQLEEECFGVNTIGTWAVVDSIERTYFWRDSISFNTFEKKIVLYDNGIGNLQFQFSTDNNFFSWTLQCDPDIFIMSMPFNNEDSLFTPSELYTVSAFDVLINEIDFKKMKQQKTDSISGFHFDQILIRNLVRE